MAFDCPQYCVKVVDDRRPGMTLLLLEYMNDITRGKMQKDIEEAKHFIQQQAQSGELPDGRNHLRKGSTDFVLYERMKDYSWRNILNFTCNQGVTSVNAFHEKAGRSQVGLFSFFIGKTLVGRVATDAILPSALSMSDLFARCCFSAHPQVMQKHCLARRSHDEV